MTYRLMTPAEKGINRNRAIQHLCWLLGDKMYMQWAHVSLHIKVNGKYTWQFPQERDQFLAFIVPEMEKFCGKWFEECMNPDAIPHPVRIAMEWHNGRMVRDVVLKHYPQYAKLLPMVHDRCERMGITLNVPSTEWEVAA